MPAATVQHRIQLDLDDDAVLGGYTFMDAGEVARGLGLTLTSTDADEDLTALGHVLDAGVEAERGRNQVKSLSPPVANSLTWRVRNADGRYSPTNPASPIYPNLDIGRAARYSLAGAGATYEVVRGALDLIDPHPEWERRDVELGALSQLARLVDATGFSSPLYGDGTLAGGVRTDVALGYVFDAAGIPSGQRAFDAGQTKLLWFWIRPEDELFDLALRIWASEGAGARLYDGRDGKTYFKQRLAETTELRSTTVQATFRDVDDGASAWYAGWQPDAGEGNIVNACSVDWARRSVDAADAVFWTYGATVVLTGGEVRRFPVRPTSDDPIASVVALAAGTDYAVSAGSLASATFDRTSGPFVTLTLTAGAGGATLTGLQVRGKLARVTASMRIVNAFDASASIAAYGPRPYGLGTWPHLDAQVAQSLVDAVVAAYDAPRPLRTVEVPLVTDVLIDAALGREVADRVWVVNDREGFSQHMVVESVRVQTQPGRAPRAFLGCETALDTNYGVWDVGLWDDATWTP